ncbi:MAG: DUF2382 domain-containing protein [Calothrix sp. SM1_7_51]|nr:DUF2382 domain-containing protein [Calothrix sp. SM1_7_51]
MSEITNYSVNSEHNVDENLSALTQKHVETVAQETIRLLEERLIVDNNKYKVGEVIVRKVVETRTIEVPIRREKLVIEQLYPRYKKLGEISLSESEIAQSAVSDAKYDAKYDGKSDIKAEFSTTEAAIEFLNKFVGLKPQYDTQSDTQHGTTKIQIIITNSHISPMTQDR